MRFLARTLALAMLLCAAPLWAQEYPARTVTLVVPFAAGGGSDLIGRVIAREMAAQTRQNFIVDNRVGATGIVGLDYLGRAAPDGYTLMQLANATVVALLYQNRGFDADKMFTAIGNMQIGTTLIAVNPASLPVNSMAELVAYLKAHPGRTYTSSGQGSQGNLMMDGLARQLGLQITHVPYKGVAPAITDVVAGRVDFILTDSGSLRSFLEAGRLRPVVTTSTVHAPALPDLPLAVDLGYADFKYDPVSSVIAPPGMQGPVLVKLRALVKQVTDSDAFAASMKELGYKNQYMDGPALRQFMLDEYARWGRLIRESGIKPE